jgi:hypothetical protein
MSETFYAAQCGVLRGALRMARQYLDKGDVRGARIALATAQEEVDRADAIRSAELDRKHGAETNRFLRSPRVNTGD